MSFEQPILISLLSEQVNCNKPSRTLKSSTKLDFCKVCGDKATIINYGALSCQSCKTFFRRNGFHPEVCSL